MSISDILPKAAAIRETPTLHCEDEDRIIQNGGRLALAEYTSVIEPKGRAAGCKVFAASAAFMRK
jgi:hypothetical protein